MFKRVAGISGFVLLISLVLPFVSSGAVEVCLSAGPGASYAGPAPRDPQVIQYYDYPRLTADPQVRFLQDKATYVKYDVRFRSTLELPDVGSDLIQFIYYEQKGDGPHPTVLFLPITGGLRHDPGIKIMATYFAEHGFNCAMSTGRQISEKKVESGAYVENYLRQSVIDGRQILDFLELRPKVDNTRMACFGISLGAIETTLLAGVDNRVKACVMALAGGSVADIVCYSHSGMFREPRDEVRICRRISLGQLHTELESEIKTDPLKLAPYIDARNVFMVRALFDSVVPRAESNQLWFALGRPARFTTLSGHYTTIAYLPFLEKASLQFLKNRLDIP